MNNKIASSEIIQAILENGLRPPKTLLFGITDRCNLRCRHCWLECQPRSPVPDVPANTVISLVDDFRGLGGKAIWLAGGETLLHPEWFRLASSLAEFTELREIGLQTNATLITEAIADKLTSIKHPGFTIQISMDGASASTHDHVRGEGTFDQTTRGLRLLLEKNLCHQITIAFTEMRHNFHDIRSMLELVDRHKLKGLIVNSLIKGGRAVTSDRIDTPTPDQYRALIQDYLADENLRRLYQRYGAISALEWFLHRKEATGNPCHCLENPFITVEGVMYPCVMYQHDDYAASRVFDQSLATTLTANLAKWSELPQNWLKRKENLAPCVKCAGREHCGGGCVGRAITAFGDSGCVEDRCELRKVIYNWE